MVVLFPEGKRSKTDSFGKPKAGVGLLAITTGAMVIPTYIHNSGCMAKGKKIFLIYGKPVNADKFYTYQSFANHVMEGIEQLKNEISRKAS